MAGEAESFHRVARTAGRIHSKGNLAAALAGQTLGCQSLEDEARGQACRRARVRHCLHTVWAPVVAPVQPGKRGLDNLLSQYADQVSHWTGRVPAHLPRNASTSTLLWQNWCLVTKHVNVVISRLAKSLTRTPGAAHFRKKGLCGPTREYRYRG